MGKWSGQCDSCGQWNTLIEEQSSQDLPKGLKGGKGTKIRFVGLTGESAEPPRMATGMLEFDRVCGGGMVSGSAILIGGDTTGLEVSPAPKGSKSFIPVHTYLLIEQGVHIGELHNLEALARDRVYRFCYIGLVNRIRGATAGFTMRPVALY